MESQNPIELQGLKGTSGDQVQCPAKADSLQKVTQESFLNIYREGDSIAYLGSNIFVYQQQLFIILIRYRYMFGCKNKIVLLLSAILSFVMIFCVVLPSSEPRPAQVLKIELRVRQSATSQRDVYPSDPQARFKRVLFLPVQIFSMNTK